MLSSALSFLLAAVPFVTAIGQVSRGGRYLYNEDGSRFYIKGVAYQEQGMTLTSLAPIGQTLIPLQVKC